jgi:hypothetical protein
MELLLSWRRSGFSIQNRVFAHPGNRGEFEALVRYVTRSPVSLSRLRFTRGSKGVVYTRKGGHDPTVSAKGETIDAEESVARVLVQIRDPRRPLVRYYAAYSNRARGQRRKAGARVEARASDGPADELPLPGERAALRRRWANLIRRVYEGDPLVCPRCGCEMRVVGFITEPGLIKRILDHVRRRERVCRPPPRLEPAVASTA